MVNLSQLSVGERTYQYIPVADVAARAPLTVAIIAENLIRNQADPAAIEALRHWPVADQDQEVEFAPARVVMQDFTGVPCVVDLATMREAVRALGADPTLVNPRVPTELVIDHSVIADHFGSPTAFEANVAVEYRRNQERYQFLKWGQQAFSNFQVVPPGTGIVHQVNVEHLARVVMTDGDLAYPDTCVGTDSHTTMVNGLGVLGWGVGGIEAEAAMLGQPISLTLPQVIGVELTGELTAPANATDLVLTITERLRQHGVVGKFIEFFGEAVGGLGVEVRATIANMCPEYGSTACLFPIDEATLDYLTLTGRSADQVRLVEAYAKAQGFWGSAQRPGYAAILEIDLSTVEPSLAGPKRPQDRIGLRGAKAAFHQALATAGVDPTAADMGTPGHGMVAIAALTSCTNTSNPTAMVTAGLLAKNAVAQGLSVPGWVKTTLSPGSQVVSDYLDALGLIPHLEALGFYLAGYGCMTCIGNSGPLADQAKQAVDQGVIATAVLSGNRNFEGRISPDVGLNYLASPALVIAYALAGTMNLDLTTEPLGQAATGEPIYLGDLWPSEDEITSAVNTGLQSSMFTSRYANAFTGSPS
ncbi:MAG: aconitate hydratase AcnA, partial [Propionibacteriaceae bacterium]|nr:aconitate hydratase AcnA [Propionibacteriaceae bacterium]